MLSSTTPTTFYSRALYKYYNGSLLDIKFHQLNRGDTRAETATYPDLQVIRGGLGEGLHEPGRVVELATGAVATTPSTIPQRVI